MKEQQSWWGAIVKREKGQNGASASAEEADPVELLAAAISRGSNGRAEMGAVSHKPLYGGVPVRQAMPLVEAEPEAPSRADALNGREAQKPGTTLAQAAHYLRSAPATFEAMRRPGVAHTQFERLLTFRDEVLQKWMEGPADRDW